MKDRDIGDDLADIARYAATAVRLLGSMTQEELQADERTRLALERAIEILGEAAARIPQDWRARHPDLPWREMIGTHSRLAKLLSISSPVSAATRKTRRLSSNVDRRAYRTNVCSSACAEQCASGIMASCRPIPSRDRPSTDGSVRWAERALFAGRSCR